MEQSLHIWHWVLCFALFSGSIPGNARVTLRLVGGRNDLEGRVEIITPHTGTVCDDGWGAEDARVVCKMLGLPYGNAIAKSEAYFGEGSGNIVLDDVGCIGGEGDIGACPRNSWNSHNCGHGEDAGVICGHNVNDGYICPEIPACPACNCSVVPPCPRAPDCRPTCPDPPELSCPQAPDCSVSCPSPPACSLIPDCSLTCPNHTCPDIPQSPDCTCPQTPDCTCNCPEPSNCTLSCPPKPDCVCPALPDVSWPPEAFDWNELQGLLALQQSCGNVNQTVPEAVALRLQFEEDIAKRDRLLSLTVGLGAVCLLAEFGIICFMFVVVCHRKQLGKPVRRASAKTGFSPAGPHNDYQVIALEPETRGGENEPGACASTSIIPCQSKNDDGNIYESMEGSGK